MYKNPLRFKFQLLPLQTLGQKYLPLQPPLPLGKSLTPLGRKLELSEFLSPLIKTGQEPFSVDEEIDISWFNFSDLASIDDFHTNIDFQPAQQLETTDNIFNDVLPTQLEQLNTLTSKTQIQPPVNLPEITSLSGEVETASNQATSSSTFTNTQVPPVIQPSLETSTPLNTTTPFVDVQPAQQLETIDNIFSNVLPPQLEQLNSLTSETQTPVNLPEITPLSGEVETASNQETTLSTFTNNQLPSAIPPSLNTLTPLNTITPFVDVQPAQQLETIDNIFSNVLPPQLEQLNSLTSETQTPVNLPEITPLSGEVETASNQETTLSTFTNNQLPSAIPPSLNTSTPLNTITPFVDVQPAQQLETTDNAFSNILPTQLEQLNSLTSETQTPVNLPEITSTSSDVNVETISKQETASSTFTNTQVPSAIPPSLNTSTPSDTTAPSVDVQPAQQLETIDNAFSDVLPSQLEQLNSLTSKIQTQTPVNLSEITSTSSDVNVETAFNQEATPSTFTNTQLPPVIQPSSNTSTPSDTTAPSVDVQPAQQLETTDNAFSDVLPPQLEQLNSLTSETQIQPPLTLPEMTSLSGEVEAVSNQETASSTFTNNQLPSAIPPSLNISTPLNTTTQEVDVQPAQQLETIDNIFDDILPSQLEQLSSLTSETQIQPPLTLPEMTSLSGEVEAVSNQQTVSSTFTNTQLPPAIQPSLNTSTPLDTTTPFVDVQPAQQLEASDSNKLDDVLLPQLEQSNSLASEIQIQPPVTLPEMKSLSGEVETASNQQTTPSTFTNNQLPPAIPPSLNTSTPLNTTTPFVDVQPAQQLETSDNKLDDVLLPQLEQSNSLASEIQIQPPVTLPEMKSLSGEVETASNQQTVSSSFTNTQLPPAIQPSLNTSTPLDTTTPFVDVQPAQQLEASDSNKLDDVLLPQLEQSNSLASEIQIQPPVTLPEMKSLSGEVETASNQQTTPSTFTNNQLPPAIPPSLNTSTPLNTTTPFVDVQPAQQLETSDNKLDDVLLPQLEQSNSLASEIQIQPPVTLPEMKSLSGEVETASNQQTTPSTFTNNQLPPAIPPSLNTSTPLNTTTPFVDVQPAQQLETSDNKLDDVLLPQLEQSNSLASEIQIQPPVTLPEMKSLSGEVETTSNQQTAPSTFINTQLPPAIPPSLNTSTPLNTTTPFVDVQPAQQLETSDSTLDDVLPPQLEQLNSLTSEIQTKLPVTLPEITSLDVEAETISNYPTTLPDPSTTLPEIPAVIGAKPQPTSFLKKSAQVENADNYLTVSSPGVPDALSTFVPNSPITESQVESASHFPNALSTTTFDAEPINHERTYVPSEPASTQPSWDILSIPILKPLGQLLPLAHNSNFHIQEAIAPPGEISNSESTYTQPQLIKHSLPFRKPLDSLPPLVQKSNFQMYQSAVDALDESPNISQEIAISTEEQKYSSTIEKLSPHIENIPESWSSISELLKATDDDAQNQPSIESLGLTQSANLVNTQAPNSKSSDEIPNSWSNLSELLDKNTTSTPEINELTQTESTSISLVVPKSHFTSNFKSDNKDSQQLTRETNTKNLSLDAQTLEILAQHIYTVLVQNLEIEQQRLGRKYFGHPSWFDNVNLIGENLSQNSEINLKNHVYTNELAMLNPNFKILSNEVYLMIKERL
jgi:hypothetical protein